MMTVTDHDGGYQQWLMGCGDGYRLQLWLGGGIDIDGKVE